MNIRKSAALLVAIQLGIASTGVSANTSDKKAVPSDKPYSPYVSTMPQNVYWGDSHLHTGLSLDAGLFGNTVGLDEAYRLAKGEKITSSTGLPVKLSRPLDWMIVTDHTDLMGLASDIQKGTPNILAVAKGKEWHTAFKKGGSEAGVAAFDLIGNFAQGTLPIEMLNDYSPGSKVFNGVWKQIVDAADRHNEHRSSGSCPHRPSFVRHTRRAGCPQLQSDGQ